MSQNLMELSWTEIEELDKEKHEQHELYKLPFLKVRRWGANKHV